MIEHKRIRERGKVCLSKLFQELKEGDKVAVIRNLSFPASFPERLQGLTGIITEKRGRSYVVRIMTGNKEKQFIIQKIHLKKLK